MRFQLWFGLALSAILAACFQGSLDDDGAEGEDGKEEGSGQPPADLPCDIAGVLASCTGCHAGSKPSGGVRIASAADLAAPAPSDPSLTVAQQSLVRMKDGSMPPGSPLSAEEISTFETWIADGMPAGDCSGAGGAPPVEVVCTSMTYWQGGDEGSEDMTPGQACVSCHEKPNDEGETGPRLLFGGTVYPTLHEPDDCNGIGGAVVVVTDANGRTVEATVRASGNFFAEEGAPLVLPIRAEVRKGDKVLEMKDPVDSVDCNSCHTALGDEDAPGRIILP
jgi:hypothetical protein